MEYCNRITPRTLMLTHNSGFCSNEVELGMLTHTVLRCRWYDEHLHNVMQPRRKHNLQQPHNVNFSINREEIKFLGVPFVLYKLTHIVDCLAVILDHIVSCMCFCYCATSVCYNVVQRRMACIVLPPWYRIVTMALQPYKPCLWNKDPLIFDTNPSYLLQTTTALPCYLMLSAIFIHYNPLSFVCTTLDKITHFNSTAHPLHLPTI